MTTTQALATDQVFATDRHVALVEALRLDEQIVRLRQEILGEARLRFDEGVITAAEYDFVHAASAGFDARSAEIILGTSSGATVAAYSVGQQIAQHPEELGAGGQLGWG